MIEIERASEHIYYIEHFRWFLTVIDLVQLGKLLWEEASANTDKQTKTKRLVCWQLIKRESSSSASHAFLVIGSTQYTLGFLTWEPSKTVSTS